MHTNDRTAADVGNAAPRAGNFDRQATAGRTRERSGIMTDANSERIVDEAGWELVSLAGDYSTLLIKALTSEEVLSEIPAVKTIVGVTRAAVAFRDRLL